MDFKERLRKYGEKLVHKYRITIDTEHTFEHRLSFRISRLEVLILLTISSIIVVISTIILLKYTSLKEYITGYDLVRMNSQIIEASIKLDSLDLIVGAHEKYESNIRKIFNNEVDVEELKKYEDYSKTALHHNEKKFKEVPLSKEEKELRNEIDTEDKFNIDVGIGEYQILFSPLKGTVIKKFNYGEQHFGLDIIANKNEPVKSIADGTIIFSGWTIDEGQAIILSHNNGNLISVYKHIDNTAKHQGDFVKSGEVIGAVERVGTPPQRRLYFEIWMNNHPINPEKLISF